MPGELPLRQCHYCQQDKTWVFSGTKLRDGSKVYTDAGGLRWAGRRCPDCERARVQAASKCPLFERQLILAQLRDAGFSIMDATFPFKVEKDGKTYSVGLHHAHTGSGGIVLKDYADQGTDLYALVFTSVRICSAEQLAQLQPPGLVAARASRPAGEAAEAQ